jgi:hypothetical protein
MHVCLYGHSAAHLARNQLSMAIKWLFLISVINVLMSSANEIINEKQYWRWRNGRISWLSAYLASTNVINVNVNGVIGGVMAS